MSKIQGQVSYTVQSLQRGIRMEDKRFTLRLDKEIFDRISGLAEQHRRSTAKEIEQAIAMYLEFQDIEEHFGNAGLSDTDLDCEKTFQIKNAYRRFVR